jgi:choline dehydrogenase-like flavoprotein
VSFIDRDTKEHFDAEARVVVLCASAIESVRILLNSGQEGNPNGLGGSSGLLGRFLMDHCMVTVAGTVPADWVRRSGPEPIGSNDDPYDLAANYIYLPGFKNITEPSPEFVGSYGILGQVGRANAYHFIGLGEMLPRFENRVTLSTKVRDAWGIPAAYIECAHSENEHALLADMTRTMQDLAVAGGLPVQELIRRRGGGIRDALYRRLRHKVWTSYGAFHPGAAIHELGGARMGDDPRNSVLDRFNRCWDVPNVFVTDGACFVSSGHQSTTLTIMALTVRACESIVSQFRKGDL